MTKYSRHKHWSAMLHTSRLLLGGIDCGMLDALELSEAITSSLENEEKLDGAV